MHIDISLMEIALYVIGAICFFAGRSIYGTRQTWLFFLGVAIVAGFNEHVNTFLGRYNYLWQLG